MLTLAGACAVALVGVPVGTVTIAITAVVPIAGRVAIAISGRVAVTRLARIVVAVARLRVTIAIAGGRRVAEVGHTLDDPVVVGVHARVDEARLAGRRLAPAVEDVADVERLVDARGDADLKAIGLV